MQLQKLGEWARAHPEITVALFGACVALELYKLFDLSAMCIEEIREARRIASDAARAASEALGG
jgi:hypothetical protein